MRSLKFLSLSSFIILAFSATAFAQKCDFTVKALDDKGYDVPQISAKGCSVATVTFINASKKGFQHDIIFISSLEYGKMALDIQKALFSAGDDAESHLKAIKQNNDKIIAKSAAHSKKLKPGEKFTAKLDIKKLSQAEGYIFLRSLDPNVDNLISYGNMVGLIIH